MSRMLTEGDDYCFEILVGGSRERYNNIKYNISGLYLKTKSISAMSTGVGYTVPILYNSQT